LGVALLLLLPLTGCGRPVVDPIVLATTTSVGNSGLLDALLPPFERDVGLRVRVHLVGSGRALRMIEDGIADVAISHAPERETALLREHPEWFYRKLMYNDFVIVGPKDDPAGAFGAPDVASAMRRIAESQARFASRGDSSGTHEREQALWNSAGIRVKPERVTTTGQGMAATLRVADEMSAYTLTDRATFAQFSRILELRIVFEGGGELLNTYAVIVPHEDGRPRRPEAAVFGRWLTERRARDLIAGFRVRGAPAFSVWPPNRPAGSPADLP
jgi:tungstate transport system substrate-binding protein